MFLDYQRVLQDTAEPEEFNGDVEQTRMREVNHLLELTLGGEQNLLIAILCEEGLLVAVDFHSALGRSTEVY